MEQQIFEIPTDVIPDVTRVILQCNLEHRFMDAGRESVTMQIIIPESNHKAKHSIEEIISDYNFFRYGENE